MKINDEFASLTGEWRGSNRLHMAWTPENPVRDSESSANVSLAAGGHFLKIDYDWVFEGDRKEGTILLSLGKEGRAEKVWFDSFHQSGGFLVGKGTYDGGRLDVLGSYAVPGHPDWGWQTVIEANGADDFAVTMFNISPEGERQDAVEMRFARTS